MVIVSIMSKPKGYVSAVFFNDLQHGISENQKSIKVFLQSISNPKSSEEVLSVVLCVWSCCLSDRLTSKQGSLCKELAVRSKTQEKSWIQA